ncbi:hypothetical protein RQP46_007319 [Phenoliferia psychrophenolica]
MPTVYHSTITDHTNLLFTPASSPFLPIRPSRSSAHSPYQLTPLLAADLPHLVATLNDASVWPNFVGSPYPYQDSDARKWLALKEKETREIMAKFQKGEWDVEGCPVATIRETATGAWAGAIGVDRWGYPNLEGEERRAAKAANDARALGDPDLVWTVGYYLSPNSSSKGLMTSTLRTLIVDYLIPVLHIRNLRSSALTHNPASRRVQEKCGFREIGKFNRVMDQGRGGGVVEEWLMEWKAEWME